MVEARIGSQGLTEASRNNFSLERFFVTADDQIRIIESEGRKAWVVNVENCFPLTVGVSELEDGEISKSGRHKRLIPGEAYRVCGKSIFIATTIRSAHGQRILKMIGPVGTKFEKVEEN